MNSLDFGEKMPSRGNKYFQVKEKGDSIRFRIAQKPAYEGKHFLQTEDGWDIKPCPRINNQEECEYCETYFAGIAESKKLKDSDPDESKKLEKDARKYSCSVSFYFPVLNRDTESFVILQTTPGVRNKLNALFEAGVKVFERDFILKNTGSATPADKYSVAAVDSADTPAFTEQEEMEFQKAKEFDQSSITESINVPDDAGDTE